MLITSTILLGIRNFFICILLLELQDMSLIVLTYNTYRSMSSTKPEKKKPHSFMTSRLQAKCLLPQPNLLRGTRAKNPLKMRRKDEEKKTSPLYLPSYIHTNLLSTQLVPRSRGLKIQLLSRPNRGNAAAAADGQKRLEEYREKMGKQVFFSPPPPFLTA